MPEAQLDLMVACRASQLVDGNAEEGCGMRSLGGIDVTGKGKRLFEGEEDRRTGLQKKSYDGSESLAADSIRCMQGLRSERVDFLNWRRGTGRHLREEGLVNQIKKRSGKNIDSYISIGTNSLT